MSETVRQSSRISIRVMQDIWDVVRAATPKHMHLRNRLVKAVLITLLVDLVGSTAMLFAEHNTPSSQIHGFWDALYWTTSQLTTLTAPMSNPVSTAGQVVALLLNFYAITVVSTLAGMFSAFFYQHEKQA